MLTKLLSAGIPISDLAGSQTSVYVGCFTRDFESVEHKDHCRNLAALPSEI